MEWLGQSSREALGIDLPQGDRERSLVVGRKPLRDPPSLGDEGVLNGADPR
jgi:hypothetical protein